ncbi:Helicase associated domain HA2 [Aspergillus sclerotialis]|uniref:RNA helicase n=1 Tax=Aspergillus sclerotialis TaxID=2070753 RepID=A0A3A2ZXG9_9EURO|nr:Helicase associated domain HA2 [Aspergillus sclerotialis]
MRPCTSTRSLLLSVENGTTEVGFLASPRASIVFGYNQRRRIHTHFTNFTRFLTSLKYGPRNSTLNHRRSRVNRPSTLSAPICYSATKPEPDQSNETASDPLVFAEDGCSKTCGLQGSHRNPDSLNSFLERTENSAPASSSAQDPETKEGDRHAYFGKQDYHGLGAALLESPKGTLYKEFVNKGYIKLKRSTRLVDDETFLYSLNCKNLDQPEIVAVAWGKGKSKGKAGEKAFRSLVFEMHKNGMLQNLVDKVLHKREEPTKLGVRLDDHSLIMMRRALWNLRQAGALSTVEANRQRIRPPAAKYISMRNITIPNPRRIHISMVLKNRLKRYLGNPDLAKLHNRLNRLQINQRKEDILNLVHANTYSIIVAATGTGKSTQLPQIILNDAIDKNSGARCKVICVQPRRIAASSLARRVAHERDESLGSSVGYHVRFDHKPARNVGSITYCTTGIMLELLQNIPGYLDSVSHIVLDEVHERDVGLDLLMLLLRNYINERKAKNAYAPKLIVTSATLDIELFSSYFQNKLPDGTLSPAPQISIPGRTFEVTKHFLEDVIDSFSCLQPETLKELLRDPGTAYYLEEESRYQSDQVEEKPAPRDYSPEKGEPPVNGHLFARTARFERDEEDMMPVGLVCAAICSVLSTTTDGAVLVFLPGIVEIVDVESKLRAYGKELGLDFSNTNRFQILKLHSSLPESHNEPFRPSPPGCRRIFLATNIAETSITMPDVKYVIDLGKQRKFVHHAESRSRKFGSFWISHSCAAQRAGRAGRVRDGKYFALFSKKRYDSFGITKVPEMALCSLDEVCLRVKSASSGARIEDFLQGAIEPPKMERVRIAIEELQHMGALDKNEELTTLGAHLSKLPLPPSLGKLILLGVIFRCLDPLLILGAMGDFINLFRLVFGNDDLMQRAELRKEYAEISSSDHITSINIFKAVRNVYQTMGASQAREFADSQFVHFGRFQDTHRVARQILSILADSGFIPHANASHDHLEFGGPELNVNSGRTTLIKGLLLHVNSLNIAAHDKTNGNLYRTSSTHLAKLPRSSVNSKLRPLRNILVYDWKEPFSHLFQLRNTTHVTSLAACLFGGPLRVTNDEVSLNSWLTMTVGVKSEQEREYAVKLLLELRKALDLALRNAIPSLNRPDERLLANQLSPSSTSCDSIIEALSETLAPILDGEEAGRGTSKPANPAQSFQNNWVAI